MRIMGYFSTEIKVNRIMVAALHVVKIKNIEV